MISIFGSPPLFNTFVLSKFKQPNVLSSQMLCRHDDNSPHKMIELNFAISNSHNFAKTYMWWTLQQKWNASEGSSNTLNDANKQEQLTMPVARSHRYCQNYNLNHFLSNKHMDMISRGYVDHCFMLCNRTPSKSKAE